MSLEFFGRAGPNVSTLSHEAIASVFEDDRDRQYEQAERMRETLRLFGPDLLSQRAIEAAGLIPVARLVQGSADPAIRLASAKAIDNCLNQDGTPVSQEDGHYMMSIWGDLPYINNAALNYRSRLMETGAGREVLDVLSLPDDKPLPADYWLDVKLGINVPLLAELSEQVNVESILANAAYRLDQLVNSDMGSRRQLELILEIETFYAPLLDALGMSAFEMMLRSEVNKIRLINAGRTDLIDAATSEIRKVETIGLNPILQSIFDKAPNEKKFEIDDQTPYGEVITFSEADLSEVTDGEFDGRLVVRVKSLGSTAQKMRDPRYAGEMPQDIVGMTAIVSSEDDIVAYFKEVLKTIEDSGGKIKLKNAASKSSALYLQGTKDYVESITGALGSELIADMEIKEMETPLEKTFQVLKMTFTVDVEGHEIPVEFQFITNDDRTRARLGGVSHLMMEKNAAGTNGLAGTKFGNEDSLERINRRRKDLQEGDKNNIVPINNHGDEYGMELASALWAA